MRDDKGAYKLKNFIRLADGKYATRQAKPDFWYPIYVSSNLQTIKLEEFENSVAVYPITDTGVERTWKTTKETCSENIINNNLIAKKENDKIYIYEKLREFQVIKTHWINKKYHGFHFGTKLLDDLLGVKTFDFPKSLYLMRDIFKLFTNSEDIILDFFSGSATSAHAIMKLNAEDTGKRKYILVQIPASCDTKSDAYKAGYKNICEIGKERIRRAGKKIKEENPLLVKDLDTGFRVFKVDSTNMEDIYYSPFEISQNLLFESNIKPDRNDLDLLFGCVLDWGLTLDMPYKCEIIDGHKVYTYANGELMACFEENITETMIDEIIRREPMRVLFRDSCFKNDCDKLSVVERFKLLAPEIEFKVI